MFLHEIAMLTGKIHVEAHIMHTHYHDNSCCLLLEVLQPILVGLPLSVPFPVGLKLHSLCFMCTKVFHPLPEGSSHQSPPPVGLQLHNQWLVSFHQCPAVIVSRHFGHHSLGDRRKREGREKEGREEEERRKRGGREEEERRKRGGGEEEERRRKREGREKEEKEERKERRHQFLVQVLHY